MKSKPSGSGIEQTSVARLQESSASQGSWMNDVRFATWTRYGLLGLAALLALMLLWPFYVVPTGSRGVVTQFGRIIGIENEGLAILPPWQRLANFSVRAEQADIENADGSTSDTQPVKVSMTVRYSIMPDKVAEVYGVGGYQCGASTEARRLRRPGHQHRHALAQNKDVLELRRIEVERVKAERWNGQLPQNVYASAPIPFLQTR